MCLLERTVKWLLPMQVAHGLSASFYYEEHTLTWAVVTMPHEVHEEQHCGYYCYDHAPDGCTNHSRVRSEGWVSCKQSHIDIFVKSSVSL